MAPRQVIYQIGSYPDSGFRKDAEREFDAHSQFIEDLHGTRDELYRNFDLVEPWWSIRNAVHDVPWQRNSWSCGMVSSARFLAMIGYPVKDYIKYHNDAPTYSALTSEIGPGPQRLYDYMLREKHLEGTNVGLNIGDDWGWQQHLLDESIRLHRPMLVLFEVANRNLHWANIVGRGKVSPFDYMFLDTDDTLRVMSASELQRRMDLGSHVCQNLLAQVNPIATFETIGRFNSFSCTWGDIAPGHGDIRSYSAHGREAELRGDRNGGHNLFNTVVNSPAVVLSPAAFIGKKNLESLLMRIQKTSAFLLFCATVPGLLTACPDFSGRPPPLVVRHNLASDCSPGMMGFLEIELYEPEEPRVDLVVQDGGVPMEATLLDRDFRRSARILRLRSTEHDCFVSLAATVAEGVCFSRGEVEACSLRQANYPWGDRLQDGTVCPATEDVRHLSVPADELFSAPVEDLRARVQQIREQEARRVHESRRNE